MPRKKTRHAARRRRNPVARQLRERLFGVRRERNRRKYTRKSKHKRRGDEGDAPP